MDNTHTHMRIFDHEANNNKAHDDDDDKKKRQQQQWQFTWIRLE